MTDRRPERPTDDSGVLALEAAGSASSATEAVSKAYAEHHRAVYGVLLRSTRSVPVAEDMLQETFLRLFREVRAGRPPIQPRAWLLKVASNLIVSHGRRLAVAQRWSESQAGRDQGAQTESPETRAVRREASAELDDALAILPRDARVALLLAGQGFSGSDIAAAIGRTEGATRTLMSRARLRLRDELRRRGSVG